MKIKNILLTSLVSASLIAPVSTAQARGTTDQTTATIVGAATGAIIGNAFGKNTKSTLIGATVGGLAGNAMPTAIKKQKPKSAMNANTLNTINPSITNTNAKSIVNAIGTTINPF